MAAWPPGGDVAVMDLSCPETANSLASPLPSPSSMGLHSSGGPASLSPQRRGSEEQLLVSVEGNDEDLEDLCDQEEELRPPEGWLRSHPSLTPEQRCLVAGWVRDAAGRQGLSLTCAEHAVALLDRYLASQQHIQAGDGWTVQLAGVACLATATKLMSGALPCSPHELQEGAPWAPFDSGSIKHMELAVLSQLDWRATALTPTNFLDRQLALAGVGRHMGALVDRDAVHAVRNRAKALLAPLLTEEEATEHRSSDLSAAAVILAARDTCPPLVAAQVDRVLQPRFPGALACLDLLQRCAPAAPLERTPGVEAGAAAEAAAEAACLKRRKPSPTSVLLSP